MKTASIRALATLIIAALPATGHAWTPDPLNGASAVCTAAQYQFYPQCVSDGSGGAIITWQDTRSGTYQIYVQRVNAQGTALWTADGVKLSNTTNAGVIPNIVSDGSGGAMVNWAESVTGAIGNLRVQRVDASGQPLWTAGGVVLCATADPNFIADATSDNAGGVVVVWGDVRSATLRNLYAQRVNPSGAPQWAANGQAVCIAASYRYNQSVKPDGAGGFLLAWDDQRLGAFDIYAQRLSGAGSPQWTANGVVVCNAANDQQNVQLVPDDIGGMVLVWRDKRTDAQGDIYGQRLSAAGAALWAANGVAIGNGTATQFTPTLVADGLGGGIVAWTDNRAGGVNAYEIYVQHMTAAGTPLWTANGKLLCTAVGDQTIVGGISDGFGGALFAWTDYRSGADPDIFADHITSDGLTLASSGIPVCENPGSQYLSGMAPDGAGGVIMAWRDSRNDPASYDIYAQHMTPQGLLGDPTARIVSVRDVANDQGGLVKMTFNASYMDAPAYIYQFNGYQIWRSVPASLLGALENQRGTTSNSREAAASGELLVGVAGLQDYAWESMGSPGYSFLPSYSVLLATTTDSLAGGNPLTAFMLETYSGNWSYFSAPDSGYSVDNLAPQPPSPFTGLYTAGISYLNWGRNLESDFAGFRLYRGGPASFVPGPANLISSQSSTGYTDAFGGTAIYKLTAVDIHGNESAPSTVVPTGALGVDLPAPARFHLEPPAPNPAAAHAQLSIRFGLAREADYDLAIFDAQGRRVRTLSHGLTGAGDHTVRWDGRAEGGSAAPAGLYFIRLDSSGQSMTRRLVRVR